MKDPYVYGHSKKVSVYATALAEKIGLSPNEVFALSDAALLHDIGKVSIPDKVLNKKGKLNKEDWEVIKAHPKLGANTIGNIPELAPAVNGILYHHERWDGTGYPEGLKGEEIPLEARIIAITNSFDAMTSNLPYRPALSLGEALTQLRQGAGLQFDPKLVEAFINIIEAQRLKNKNQNDM
jgi:putative nucleotidyltransferase with HDIG domain